MPLTAKIVREQLWQPHHGSFERSVALARVEEFARIADLSGLPLDSQLVDQSLGVMNASYDAYESPAQVMDGGPVFVGPSRMSSDNFDFLNETFDVLPLLRTLTPAELAQTSIADIGLLIMRLAEVVPPRLMENYQNIRGGIIYAPVTSQIKKDFADSTGEAIKTARAIVNDTALFARRLGAGVLGLGATLPGLTTYGAHIEKSLDTGNMRITTGHGGTAWLAGHIAQESFRYQQENHNSHSGIGVLGVGAIGSVIANFITDEIPDASIYIYDKEAGRARALSGAIAAQHPGRLEVVSSANDLFAKSTVVVSAVDTALDLSSIDPRHLEGKIIVDDSQPPSISREYAQKYGASLLWVVGRSADGSLARSSDWNFFGSLAEPADLFGCEAEALAIASLDLADRPSYNICGRAATLDDIRKIGGLFIRKKIQPAAAQSFGQPSALPA